MESAPVNVRGGEARKRKREQEVEGKRYFVSHFGRVSRLD